MKLSCRSTLFLASALLLPHWLPSPALAAADHMRYYKTGLDAAEGKNWQQVEKLMRDAIERQSKAKRRRMTRRSGYFPHYYLGLARYQLGDCKGALAAWAESEAQAAIVGEPEFSDLLKLQEDCQNKGKPTLKASVAAAPTTTGRSKKDDDREKKTGKEKVRTGQRVVEKSADGTRNALGLVGDLAPAGTELDKVVREGEKVVDMAETATDIVDLAMPPSQALERAINAYFTGKPERALALLDAVDLGDPRAKAQVYLFRAAANYRLHLLGHGGSHLEKARQNAALFQQEQWSHDFPTDLFDPRFVRFLRGGG